MRDLGLTDAPFLCFQFLEAYVKKTLLLWVTLKLILVMAEPLMVHWMTNKKNNYKCLLKVRIPRQETKHGTKCWQSIICSFHSWVKNITAEENLQSKKLFDFPLLRWSKCSMIWTRSWEEMKMSRYFCSELKVLRRNSCVLFYRNQKHACSTVQYVYSGRRAWNSWLRCQMTLINVGWVSFSSH